MLNLDSVGKGDAWNLTIVAAGLPGKLTHRLGTAYLQVGVLGERLPLRQLQVSPRHLSGLAAGKGERHVVRQGGELQQAAVRADLHWQRSTTIKSSHFHRPLPKRQGLHAHDTGDMQNGNAPPP